MARGALTAGSMELHNRRNGDGLPHLDNFAAFMRNLHDGMRHLEEHEKMLALIN